ncbi:MAG: metal-dependent hydrolase [Candidatus Heimdallarchaeota archaeon]
MCQGAHALEAIVVKKYLGKGILAWMVLGQVAPDVFTKAWIFESDNAWEAQKLPPLGLTHTPVLHLLVGLLIYVILINREKSFSKASSYVLGAWTHILMDAGDPYGVMLYYPFSESLFKWKNIVGVDLWAYGNQYSGAVDARMYFMSWGLLIEAVFLLSVLPVLPAALSRAEFDNPLEYIFTFTFVVYGASLFFILTLVPAVLGVPIPKEGFDPVFKWGPISTFSGTTPQSAIDAQIALGITMGISFLISLMLAGFLALQYYDQDFWPSPVRQYIPIAASIINQSRRSQS